MDDFQPEKLLGKTLSFKCAECHEWIEFTLLSIKKHYKAMTMGWTYKGRADLVVFEVDKHWPDKEFSMKYRTIQSLIENGEYAKRIGAQYKIIS